MARKQANSDASSPGRHSVPLSHAGRDRRYLLHVPVRTARPNCPLVIQLHGRGIDPVMFDQWTRFSALAEEAGFVLAMPRAKGAKGEIWNDGRYGGRPWRGISDVDDVGYLCAVIDDVCARLPIDRRRIYVVGMSNGATMAGRFACEQPDRIAGLAQVAGTVSDEIATDCHPAVPVPVLQIHGSLDGSAPYSGGRARGLAVRLLLRRPAGPSLGVDDWARFWVAANNADKHPQIRNLPPDVTIRRWRGATAISDVAFYRVDGGGHTWPGTQSWLPPFLGRKTMTFDATRVIWDFLSAHRREQ